MDKMKSRKQGISLIITMLIIVIAFAFTTVPAFAAKKKTVKLIKGHGLKYYKSGLVKQLNDGVVTTRYKYDSKGRIKEVKKYDCDDGMELENKYTFSYSKKGKLKKIVKSYYDNKKVVKKVTCGLEVGKNNQIMELSFIDRYGEYKNSLQCIYDNKGRIKVFSDVSRSLKDGQTTVNNYYNERNSKGYITKSIQRLDSGEDYPFTYTYQKKSGKIAKITRLNTEDKTTATYKYQYKKKKINKKYLKAVKAQQLEMLYTDSWWCLSPVYYLGQME